MKFTTKELNQLWHTSCASFLREIEDHEIIDLIPINKEWAEIFKKEKTGHFYLHWCKSLVDAKTLIAAFKIKYYDILIDTTDDETEYVIWCKKDICDGK
jgi:hypothetical protein